MPGISYRYNVTNKNTAIAYRLVYGRNFNLKDVSFFFRIVFGKDIMNNLLANSLNFSKPGVAPYIIINSHIEERIQFENENPALPAGKISPQKKYCHISIKDNGIGFDPRYKDQVFEVLKRLYGKDEYPVQVSALPSLSELLLITTALSPQRVR